MPGRRRDLGLGRQGSVKERGAASSRRDDRRAMNPIVLTLSAENGVGLAAAVLLLAYLGYALIRAERF